MTAFRSGTRSPAASRRLVRLACLVTMAVGMAACGGGDSLPRASSSSAGAHALRAAAPGQLLDQARQIIRERQVRGSGGFGRPDVMLRPMPVFAMADGGAPRHSVTAVQEAGVDEADLVKTDGRHILTMDAAASVHTWPRSPVVRHWLRQDDGRVVQTDDLELPSGTMHGLQFVPDAGLVAALVERVSFEPGRPACGFDDLVCIGDSRMMAPAMRSEVVVQTARIDDAGALAAGRRLTISGRIVSSRQIDGRLVLVTAHQPAPDLGHTRSDAAQLEQRLAALRASDILPTLRVDDGAPRPLVSETDCFAQPANASLALEVTTITVLNLRSPEAAPVSRCFLGGSEALYMSERSLYIATTRWTYSADNEARLAYPAQVSTDLHKFAFDGEAVSYRGSGSVAGHLGWDPLRKPYRLSEHDGRLRVLTFTGETGWIRAEDAGRQAPSPATLTILTEAESGGSLQAVSRLPNALRPQPLGKPGEQVYGVRFVGDQAYVVTFRRTDPLYVLDLAKPGDPRVAGVLEVPGFSDHLYPVAPGLLMGIGRDADERGVVGGVKIALFDVSDAANPAELTHVVVGRSSTFTTLDFTPHGIAMLRDGPALRVALPLAEFAWSDGAAAPVHGLLRLEVDLAGRTLVKRPWVDTPGGAFPDLANERALHIADHVYHLSRGELTGWEWR